MRVSEILAEKPGPVVSTTAETSIHDVAKVLRDKKIGLLVVCAPGDKIVGVLSERDIVRGFADQGSDITQAKVEDLMTKDVQTCEPADDTGAVLRRLWMNNIRHMPVVEDGVLVGVLSVRDLMKSLTQEGSSRARDVLIEVLREGRYYPGA